MLAGAGLETHADDVALDRVREQGVEEGIGDALTADRWSDVETLELREPATLQFDPADTDECPVEPGPRRWTPDAAS